MTVRYSRRKWLVAVHEAGHAISYIMNKQKLVWVSINTGIPMQRRNSCRARRREHMFQGFVSIDGELSTIGDITSTMSGGMAERAFLRREALRECRDVDEEELDLSFQGETSDRRQIEEMCKESKMPDTVREKLEEDAYRECERALDVIVAFASALMVRKVVARHEIMPLYEQCIAAVGLSNQQTTLVDYQ